jgi:carboxypeptidase family protein
MMRLCPKCGDYYADASLAFCLSDGAPLINVSPNSEGWSEGARVMEGKENALKNQKRKLKWRRVVMSTMAMTTLVVVVVAVSSFIEVEPGREKDVAALPSPPETAPVEPAVSITPDTPEETSPTLPTTSTATVTPTPTPVYKISGRVTDGSKALGGVKITLGGAKTATTTTDANGNYIFKELLAGGSYTITPARAKVNFTPPSRSINKLRQDNSAHFVGTVQSECSEAKESSRVINKCSAEWRENIWGDRFKIIADYLPGLENPSASLSEIIDYRVTFSKPCQAGVVTASYTWHISAPIIRIRPLSKKKKLSFKKAGETWRCIAN